MTSIFLEFTGDSPTMRVMQYVIECRDLDFCFSDLADNAKVSRPTLYKLWENLLHHEMVVYTRKIGKSKLYKVNMQNANVRKLAEIYDSLTLQALAKQAHKQKRRRKTVSKVVA